MLLPEPVDGGAAEAQLIRQRKVDNPASGFKANKSKLLNTTSADVRFVFDRETECECGHRYDGMASARSS